MNDIDLDALEATARAATPGPWHYDPEDGGIDRLEDDEGEIVAAGRVVGTFWPHGGPTRRLLLESRDADHIAAFDPTTALTLIARLREAEEETARLRALSTRWQEVIDAPGFVRAVEAESRAYHDSACVYRERLREAEELIAKIDAEIDQPVTDSEVLVAIELHLAAHKTTKTEGND